MRSVNLPLLTLLIALSACRHDPSAAHAQTDSKTKPLIRLAGVERIDPVIIESNPVQVRVVVYGWLSDSCTSLRSFDQKTRGTVITLRVLTKRPGGVMCAQVIRRFQETYPVEIKGLAPGTYTLTVNGKSKQITLP